MTLKELQKAIDFIRENYDDWGNIEVIVELEGSGNQILSSEIINTFIPDDEEVLIMRNYV